MKLFFSKICKQSLLLFGLIYFGSVTGQEPDGYYDAATGLAEGELKSALHHIIKGGKRLTYGSGAGKTWSGFEKTDLHPDGYVWDMYSDRKVKFPGGGGVPSGMNIEHSVANSWWGGYKNDAFKDLYHLNPSYANANAKRSNYPLGEVAKGEVVGTIKVGNNTFGTEYNDISFEPSDQYKGDFARAYMYMFTCYEDLTWTGTKATSMLKNEKYPMLRPWAADLLLKWHRNDPVSEKEINRAAEIYKIQENRNPFIDYPEIAEYLWGDKKGEPFFFTPSTEPVFLAPARNATFRFAPIHYQSVGTIEIKISARNLTSDIRIGLSGTDASLFKLSQTSITPEMAQEGFMLNVTFHPVKAIPAQALLTLSSDGIETRTVSLEAEATEDFSALPAKNITHNSFEATWTPSSLTNRFSLEVYTKEVTILDNVLIHDASFAGKMAPGWSESGYSSFTDGNKDGIRLASGSSAGTLTSPEMDLSIGGRLVFVAKQWDGDGLVKVRINYGANILDEITLSEQYSSYEVTIPKTDLEAEITFYAQKGKRLFISSAQIYSEGEIIRKVPLAGYPKQIEGATSFFVEQLQPDQFYYYRITPELPDVFPSEEVEVKTPVYTSLSEEKMDKFDVFVSGKDIRIETPTDNGHILIHDITGKLVRSIIISGRIGQTQLPHSGIYFITLQHGNGNSFKKIMIP